MNDKLRATPVAKGWKVPTDWKEVLSFDNLTDNTTQTTYMTGFGEFKLLTLKVNQPATVATISQIGLIRWVLSNALRPEVVETLEIN